MARKKKKKEIIVVDVERKRQNFGIFPTMVETPKTKKKPKHKKVYDDNYLDQ